MNPSIQRSLDQAGRLLKAFDFERAQALYRAVLDSVPNNGAALLGQALILNRTGQNREALSQLERLLQQIEHEDAGKSAELRATSRAEVLAQMGLALQILGNTDKALLCYRESLRHHTNSQIERRVDQIEAEMRGSDPAFEAVRAARKARDKGQRDVAARQYQAALGRFPDIHEALYGLGELHRQQGSLGTAQLLLQQAVVMQPTSPEYQLALGLVFAQRGEHDKALGFFHRVADHDPRNADIHRHLGDACRELERYSEALTHYRQAVALRPRFAEALAGAGEALRANRQYEQAREMLERALAVQADFPEARQGLEQVMSMLQASVVADAPAAHRRKAGARNVAAVPVSPAGDTGAGKQASRGATARSRQADAASSRKPVAPRSTTTRKPAAKPTAAAVLRQSGSHPEAPRVKTATGKPATRGADQPRSTPGKPRVKNSPVKKQTPKKAALKKAAPRNTAPKKPTPRKAAPVKAVPKKPTANKAKVTPVKSAAAKRRPTKAPARKTRR